jgi:hypothetical protein
MQPDEQKLELRRLSRYRQLFGGIFGVACGAAKAAVALAEEMMTAWRRARFALDT